jgi:hypothetical protein
MAPVVGAIGIEAGYVLAAITLFVVPIATIAFVRSGEAWREIGKGPFTLQHDELEDELPHPRHSELHQILYLTDREFDAVAMSEGRAVREAEVRQMVEAKAYRRQRRGEPPIDVEAEVERELANFVGST